MTEKPILKSGDRAAITNDTLRKYARPGELREDTVQRAFYDVLDNLVQAGWDAAVEAMTPPYEGPVRLTNGDQVLLGNQYLYGAQKEKLISLPDLSLDSRTSREGMENMGWTVEEVDA